MSRWSKSLANLTPAIDVVDRAYIYDNSEHGVDARLCAHAMDGELRMIYVSLPEWVSDVGDPLPRHADFTDHRDR